MQFKKNWDLDSTFGYVVGEDKINTDFCLYEDRVHKFIEKWDKPVEYILANFKGWLADCDSLNESVSPLMIYLSLKSSLDVGNEQIQKIQAGFSKRINFLSEKLLFIEEIYKAIGYGKLIELAKEHPEYENCLINQANNLKYMLSVPEEKVYMKLSEANSDDLYDEYLASIVLDCKGEKRSLEEISGFRQDPGRDTRILAYDTLSGFYNSDSNNFIFGNIYSSVCRNDIADMELRGIEGVMTNRNMSEEMDNDDVNQLIKVVSDNYGIYSLYLKKKAEFMGIKDFDIFDIIAPLGDTKDSLSFQSGAELYLNTIKTVNETIYQHGLEMLNGYTDVDIRKGKRGGAFCSYDRSVPQHVLLNWQNKLDDVNTLAHEFGHAFHGMLAKEQNNSNYHSPLVLAETASIFNETIMFNAVLLEAKTEHDRKVMIFNRLDDMFATIFRQIMYIRFEKICHESWLENKPLSHSDYNAIWLNECKLLYGDAIEWNERNENIAKYGWKSIPHIYHTPFYCYAYSFGNLLALNVYEEYEKAADKNAFMSKYFGLLRSGGSRKPKDILKSLFNFDISSSGFYESGLTYIKSLVEKL